MKFLFFLVSIVTCLSVNAEIFEEINLKEYSGRKYAPVSGLVVKKSENGEIVEKNHYKNGLKNGLSESFHSTGRPSAVGEFSMDNREGLWSWYRPDGSLQRKGQYVNGLWEGQWRWFDEAGNLTMEKKYRNGKEQ